MSIRAMNWAMEQRTGTPSAQCVLYVIADCADEHGGRAFPSIDYISKRSQQSRATVQRRLRDLEAMGAISRVKRFDPSGRRSSDEIHLHLDRAIVVETEDRDEGSQIDTGPPQSDTGQYHPCDGGGYQSCDPIIRPKDPKDSPPSPPPGGVGEPPKAEEKQASESFERFRSVYPIAIEDEIRTRAIWAKLLAVDRESRITAAERYREHLRSPRMAKTRPFAAHRWLGSSPASGKWQGYARAPALTDGGGPYELGSNEARAITVLWRIAGSSPPKGSHGVIYRHPITPRLLALADAPPEREWPLLGEAAQCAAWREFLNAALKSAARPRLTEIRAPWLWPPSTEGKLYVETTGPPETLMTEEDREFIRETVDHGSL